MVVDPRLIYHNAGLITNFPTFYYSWSFFKEALFRPGGLVVYVAAFLAQSYYMRWLSGLVLTGLAAVVFTGSNYYLTSIGFGGWWALGIVGPLVLLAMHSQYVYQLETFIAFVSALLIAYLLLRSAPEGRLARTVLLSVLSPLAWWVAGMGGLLGVMLCLLADWRNKRLSSNGLITLATVAAAPAILGVGIYGDPPIRAYMTLTPWSQSAARLPNTLSAGLWVMFLYLPVMATIGTFIRQRRAFPSRFKTWLNVAGAAVATIGTIWYSFDPKLKDLFAVDFHDKNGNWQNVIQIARKRPYNYLICHAANRALYQKGLMGQQMFSIPQEPTSLLLTARPAFWHKIDTCLELGLVNEAENAACIAIEIYGERPILLQRLAKINLVKGNLAAARVILGTLARCPFWRGYAMQMLDQLDRDPNILQHQSILALRRNMLRKDWVWPRDPLPELLEQDPNNRMAYEYYMAQLLLVKDLDGFIKAFNHYHFLNLKTIPRHYQEGILLAKALDRGNADLKGQQIEPQILQNMISFMKALSSYGTRLEKAKLELKAAFGDSYFYYFYLGGPSWSAQ